MSVTLTKRAYGRLERVPKKQGTSGMGVQWPGSSWHKEHSSDRAKGVANVRHLGNNDDPLVRKVELVPSGLSGKGKLGNFRLSM